MIQSLYLVGKRYFREPIQPRLIQILYLQTRVNQPTISDYVDVDRHLILEKFWISPQPSVWQIGMEAIFSFIALRGFLVKPIV